MSELRRHIMMQAQGGLVPIPANNQIFYKSINGDILDMSNICNATLISNKIVGEYMIATFDGDVISINNYQSRNIKYIDFPETCTIFNRTAFDNSYYLERIIFRASNYEFGNYCFSIFKVVCNITLYATIPPRREVNAIGRNMFSQPPIIEVTKGCADVYRNSSYWTGYTIVEMN